MIPTTAREVSASLVVILLAAATSSCFVREAVADPLLGYRGEKLGDRGENQRLSGDFVINEAKSCCADSEVCNVSRPKEGGHCADEVDARSLKEEHEATSASDERSEPAP